MLTSAQCRDRAVECGQMAQSAPNMRVKGILVDMARTWTRLALEAEQWSQMNRPMLRFNKAPKPGRLPVTSPSPQRTPPSPSVRLPRVGTEHEC